MLYSKEINFDTISSTNTYLKENYRNLDNGTVVTARHQTHGRGRMGRTWHDEDDLLLSILLKEELDPYEISKLGLVVAATLYVTLKEYVDNVAIKWPNDLLVNNKKISGVLLESIAVSNKLDCLVIGIGLNVNTTSFPSDMIINPTSLTLETKKLYAIDKIKEKLLINFEKFYNDYKNKNHSYINICRDNSMLIGKEVVINDFVRQEKGIVKEILDNGSIVIEIKNQRKEFNYGEISLSSIYKNE